MKGLAVIPARGGSKRIPRKNLERINGKTLVEHAIEAVPEGFKCVVSTDDDEIAAIAARLDAKVLLDRPHMAEIVHADYFPGLAKWQYAWICEGVGDLTIMLPPTTPTRRPEDVDRCVSAIDAHRGNFTSSTFIRCPDPSGKLRWVRFYSLSACTVSLLPSSHRSAKAVQAVQGDQNGWIVLNKEDTGADYTRDGACFAATPAGLFDFYRNCMAVASDHPQVNIDEPFDLEMARWLMNRSS